jgi:hypothetical protein
VYDTKRAMRSSYRASSKTSSGIAVSGRGWVGPHRKKAPRLQSEAGVGKGASREVLDVPEIGGSRDRASGQIAAPSGGGAFRGAHGVGGECERLGGPRQRRRDDDPTTSPSRVSAASTHNVVVRHTSRRCSAGDPSPPRHLVIYP